MPVSVTVEYVHLRQLAAVRREVAAAAAGSAWRPALDKAWAFVRGQPGLWTDGHNVSWEIYGNPTPGPADTQTTVVRVLQ